MVPSKCRGSVVQRRQRRRHGVLYTMPAAAQHAGAAARLGDRSPHLHRRTRGEALIYDPEQVCVLQRCSHALLVVKLLVHRNLAGMGAGRDTDRNLESPRQRPQQFHSDTQADECGHGAVWDGRRERHVHHIALVVNRNVLQPRHIQLFQRQGVLRVLQAPYQLKHLPLVNTINARRVIIKFWQIFQPSRPLEGGGLRDREHERVRVLLLREHHGGRLGPKRRAAGGREVARAAARESASLSDFARLDQLGVP
mmetsp:Transcript_116217/g.281986  ORF Transcript_116217/g.281986 Transcript_116217/m.281986 type:complete len:253 (+) Transcript_116217:216-974(+)